MRNITFIMTLSAFLVPACTTSDTANPSNKCNAQAYARLIGQGEDALAFSGLLGKARILGPGSMATLDIQDDRINVVIDDNRIITAIYCG
jgi:hypothetical protein